MNQKESSTHEQGSKGKREGSAKGWHTILSSSAKGRGGEEKKGERNYI
jgi:hypothetical protein